MDTRDLSYILTTKNKLPYLKTSLEKLLQQKKEGEEILVADGASTDGAREYLTDLKESGKIDYLVSEPDYGESHALNKLLFAARGKLIKVVTDDDVFHYPTIALCKKFMMEHHEIDFVSANGGFKNQDPETQVRPLVSTGEYKLWQKYRTPFSFCGLGYIVRKSALPVVGLWNISFRRADAEYTLRLTSGKANLAWYTGYAYVNVSNPASVSIVHQKKIKDETDRLNKFYLNKNPDNFLVEKFKIARNKVHSTLLGRGARLSSRAFSEKWPALAATTEKWLEDRHKEKHEFLWNKQYAN